MIQLEEKIKASKLQIKTKNLRLKRQSKRIDRLKKELKKTRKFTKKNYCDMSGKQKLSFRKDVLGKLNGAINDGNQHNDANVCLFIAHLIKRSNNKLIMAQRLKSLIEEDAIGEAFRTHVVEKCVKASGKDKLVRTRLYVVRKRAYIGRNKAKTNDFMLKNKAVKLSIEVCVKKLNTPIYHTQDEKSRTMLRDKFAGDVPYAVSHS